MPPYLVLDACVLMSGVLRPWFLKLAEHGLFEPRWSERIGREWRRNAARIWDIAPELLQDEWQAMQRQCPAANVTPAEPECDLPNLRYSDPKDWHVIQTAWLTKQAQPHRRVGVVTLNLKDFSRSELRGLGIDLWEPDRLLCDWWVSDPELIKRTLLQVIDELVIGQRRERAPLSSFLKRERLFRLNKLMQADDEDIAKRP
jgi:hypothetical protein